MTQEGKYLSPLVSCLDCREVKSAKGIFSHFITAHTEDGKERLKSVAVKGSKTASQNSKRKAELLRIEKEENYNKSPRICDCGKKIIFEKRHNKFCSHSCAATNSNKKRTKESRDKQRESVKKAIKKITDSRPKYNKIEFKSCKLCDKQYTYSKQNSNSTPSFCSSICLNENKRISLRKVAIKRNLGGVRQSKRIQYNGVSLGSSYELKLALILDKLSIKWNQPKRVKYTKPCGKNSTYTADFYLPEYDLYLDPKNDFLIHKINPGNGIKDIDKIAFVAEQNSIAVCVIDQHHITEEFILKLVRQEGFEPSIILSCKDSGFDHSHHCPIVYI